MAEKKKSEDHTSDDERMQLPDGHRYDAPESKEDRDSKGFDYLILGALVLILMVLFATGTIPLYSW